jgi:hypothetical protein
MPTEKIRRIRKQEARRQAWKERSKREAAGGNEN